MPQKPKSEYLPELDTTYFDYGNGIRIRVKGNQVDNPMYSAQTPESRQVIGKSALKQLGKDLAVNTASQLPLAIPALGLPARLGISFLTGLGTDRVINSDKNVGDSIADAALNTTLGGVTEGLAGGTLKLKSPNAPRIGVGGGTWRTNLWANLKGISPITRDPLAIRPGSDVLELLDKMPSLRQQLVSMGVKGAVSNAQRDAALGILNTLKRDILLDSFKKMGLYNLLPGVATNSLVDATINAPAEQ